MGYQSSTVFGVNFPDPIATWYSNKNDRKNAAYQAALSYGYALRGLREGPSAQKEGLIKAGYNPMLAIGGVAQPEANFNMPNSSGVSTGFDPSAFAEGKTAFALQKLNVDNAKKQGARLDAETNALKANTAADVRLKIAEADKIRKESDSINPVVEKENRKYGNGLVGEAMRFVRTFKEGVGSSNSPVDSRLGDYVPVPSSSSSARQVKVISDAAHREEKRRGDAVRKRRMHH